MANLHDCFPAKKDRIAHHRMDSVFAANEWSPDLLSRISQPRWSKRYGICPDLPISQPTCATRDEP
jgi:hypothetical protein